MDNIFSKFNSLYLFNKIKLIRITVIGLIFPATAIMSITAQAANEKSEIPWYEVEVIIFANQQKRAADTETWPEEVSTAGYDYVLDLALPGFSPLKPKLPPVNAQAAASSSGPAINNGDIYANGAYVLLDKDFFQLSNVAKKIDNSSQYDVVLHLAWRQPTFDEDKSIPVFVFNNMLERDPTPEPISNSGTNQGYDFYVNGLETGPQYYWLSGTLKLSVSRYLHLESDLHIKMRTTRQEVIEESPPQESGGFGSFFGMSREPTPIMIERPVLQDYRLFETRRMRSTEIHYFDHPLMGIVVKVTPYEVEVPVANPPAVTTIPQ
ncbi:CsiV family protein [Kaarinaea lacus]